MHVVSIRANRATRWRVVASTVALAGASWAGWQIASGSKVPLLATLALGITVAITRSPRLWLVLLVILSAFRSYDNALMGGLVSWSKLLTLAMAAVYGARLATRGARIHVFGDWLLPQMLIIGWGVTSMLWAYDKSLALWTLVSWISLFILQTFIYTLFRDDFRAVEVAIYTYIAAMTAFSLIGISFVFSGQRIAFGQPVSGWVMYSSSFGTPVGRFYGFYADSNATALLLGYAILLAVTQVFSLQSRGGSAYLPLFLFVSIWPMMFAMVTTFSRTGLAAFLIGIAYLAYRARGRLTTLLAIAGFLGVVYLLREGIVSRFIALPETGWGTRLFELQLGLRQFAEAPLTGIGLMSFQPKLLSMGTSVFRGDTPVIHNTYLKFLVELGLPGLILLVWFIVALIRRYKENMRIIDHRTLPRLYWVNVGLGACFLSTAVFALALGVDSFNVLWILFGLFAVTSSTIEESYLHNHLTHKEGQLCTR